MCKLPDGTQKISIAEMVNSASNGKTSNSGVVGLVTCLVMLLVFVALTIYYFCMNKNISIAEIDILKLKVDVIKEIMEYCTIFFGMGTALLGVRKIAGAVGSKRAGNATNDTANNVTNDTSENLNN